jgi:isocitrate dehydrogenase kinase/phosphatase
MRHHADLFDPALWQRHKEKLLLGEIADFVPYDHAVRFCVRYPERFQGTGARCITRALETRTRT